MNIEGFDHDNGAKRFLLFYVIPGYSQAKLQFFLLSEAATYGFFVFSLHYNLEPDFVVGSENIFWVMSADECPSIFKLILDC